MLSPTHFSFDIEPIQKQVSKFLFDKRLTLNYTEGKLLNGPYKLLPELVGTPLGNMLSSLGNIGEARLMKLGSAETYTAHSDPDDRYHLAIETNPQAYLIDLDAGELFHLPADGRVWHMDTSPAHVAANFGARPRIHLNIRLLLPEFKSPGYMLSINGGDYDWKQESYTILMSLFNRYIKNSRITGFEKIDDRRVLLNCNPSILDTPIQQLKAKGFDVTLEPV